MSFPSEISFSGPDWSAYGSSFGSAFSTGVTAPGVTDTKPTGQIGNITGEKQIRLSPKPAKQRKRENARPARTVPMSTAPMKAMFPSKPLATSHRKPLQVLLWLTNSSTFPMHNVSEANRKTN